MKYELYAVRVFVSDCPRALDFYSQTLEMPVAVSLQVEDVQSAYQTLVSRGVEFVAPLDSQPWGGVLAHFRDPDLDVLTRLGT